MRALTVRQPWAWAIAHGGKRVENRSQLWRYRGPFAVHAAAHWSPGGEVSPLVHAAAVAARDAGVIASTIDVVRGWGVPYRAVVAVAELLDVHPDAGCCEPWGEHTWVGDGDEVHTVVHLVLGDVRALTVPVPVGGALGLWTLPPDVEAAVMREIG